MASGFRCKRSWRRFRLRGAGYPVAVTVSGWSAGWGAVAGRGRSWRGGSSRDRCRSWRWRSPAGVMVRPRQPAEARSRTAQTRPMQEVSPGKRPMTLARRRVRPGEDVQVGRLPGVDGAAELGQPLEVGGRVVRLRHGHPLEVCRIARLRRQLGADRVAGLAEVAGHLEGQHTFRGQRLDDAGQQVKVPGDPLQRGIAHDDIGRRPARPRPVTQVAQLEADPLADAVVTPSRLEHRRGAVDPDDLGPGPALTEDGGEIARAAAEVDDSPRCSHVDPSHEVEEGPGALTGIPEVGVRVPGVRHGGSPPSGYLDVKTSAASGPGAVRHLSEPFGGRYRDARVAG